MLGQDAVNRLNTKKIADKLANRSSSKLISKEPNKIFCSVLNCT
jgi:hypothetical protein